jgi:hypothetical protein
MLTLNGFPRSGNNFLNHMLRDAFPGKIEKKITHDILKLEIKDCIVPIRSPYESIPSLSKFTGDIDFEGIARWYLAFNSKVLDNYDNLFVVDFKDLIKSPLNIVDRVSKKFKIIPNEVDLNSLNKNENKLEYKAYNSSLVEDCNVVYKKIIDKIYL